MTVVIVADSLPLWRLGAAAALAHWSVRGCDPAQLTQVLAAEREPLVLLTLGSTEDLNDLSGIARRPESPRVVAVLPDADAASCAIALRAGAVGVLPHNCPPSQLRRAVWAALNGRVDLPIPVLQQLTAATHQDPAGHSPSPLTSSDHRARQRGHRCPDR